MIASQTFTYNEISFFHFHTNYKRTNLILKGRTLQFLSKYYCLNMDSMYVDFAVM